MSDFTAIRSVTRTLEALLKAMVTDSSDPQLASVAIDLRSPKEMRLANATGISLWLYRVTRDPDTLNEPPRRISPTEERRAALPLHLFYLVTPLATNVADRQALLGRVVQVFNDHAQLRGPLLKDTLEDTDEQLRLTFETLPLEELTRIWNALDEPYELSVTYAVQVVRIDSDREPLRVSPVLVKETTYVQIVGQP
jgi:Pvc16 N-terminal domain